jgi:hypothetical protein
MAAKNNNPVQAGVLGADDGHLYVRGLEDRSLSEYLATYQARIEGYRIEEREWGTKVTMKIAFPPDTSRSNANLWTFFIGQAAHKLGKKPYIDIRDQGENVVGYISFNVYAHVKYMESKGGNDNSF